MSKKTSLKEDKEKKVKKVKKMKKKMTSFEKRKLIMKVAGWIMAVVMILGTLLSIIGMLVYA